MAHKRSPGRPQRNDGARSPISSHREFFLKFFCASWRKRLCGAVCVLRLLLHLLPLIIELIVPHGHPFTRTVRLNMSAVSFTIPPLSLFLLLLLLWFGYPPRFRTLRFLFPEVFNCLLPVLAFCHSLSLRVRVFLVRPPWPAHESMPHAS